MGRAAHLVPGERRVAGQPRRPAHARARRRADRRPAQRPLEHDRRLHPRRAHARVRGSRGRPRAGHRAHPHARDARPRAVARRAAWSARPSCRPRTSARSPTWRRWPRWPTRTGSRWWSTRRGARTCPSTTTFPTHALSLGADLVVSSTHKIVGSLTQSAMIHLGRERADRRARRGPLGHAAGVHQPQLAAGRRRSTRRGGWPPRAGASWWGRRWRRWPRCARPCGRSTGSTCSTSGSSAPRACTPTTRCAWPSTCAAPAPAATSWRRCCASAAA